MCKDMIFTPVPPAHQALSAFTSFPLFDSVDTSNNTEAQCCDIICDDPEADSFVFVERLPLICSELDFPELITISLRSESGFATYVLYSPFRYADELCERISAGLECSWSEHLEMFSVKGDENVTLGRFFDYDSPIARRLRRSVCLQPTLSAVRFSQMLWHEILSGGGIDELERIWNSHAAR